MSGRRRLPPISLALHPHPKFKKHQLAHAELDLDGHACNRSPVLNERIRVMQDWAAYLYRPWDAEAAKLQEGSCLRA